MANTMWPLVNLPAGEYDYTTGKFTAASPQSGASSTPVDK